MRSDHENDETTYGVVVNQEEQYSLWPSHREIPPGWKSVGKTGKKSECLQHIDLVWTDMRPKSLRRHQEETNGDNGAGHDVIPIDGLVLEEPDHGPSLVERLSQGRHSVEASLRPANTAARLKECLEREYVPIRFPQTRGATELGLRLDRAASVIRSADFVNGTGSVHLESLLTLNHQKVRCVVDLDVATLRGEGHLVPVIDQSLHRKQER